MCMSLSSIAHTTRWNKRFLGSMYKDLEVEGGLVIEEGQGKMANCVEKQLLKELVPWPLTDRPGEMSWDECYLWVRDTGEDSEF